MTTEPRADSTHPGPGLPLFLDSEIAQLRERWHRASHGFERRPLVERIRALEALLRQAQDGRLTVEAFEASLEAWRRKRQASLVIGLPTVPPELFYEDLRAHWQGWERRGPAHPCHSP